MSYFSDSAAKSRTYAATSTPHLRKDVGFGEAYRAQRLNTYGVMDEANIIRKKSAEVARWAFQNHTDLAREYSAGIEGVRAPQDATSGMIGFLRERGVEVPDELNFGDGRALENAALLEEGKKYTERQRVLSKATGAGRFGAFLGGVAGSMDDAENIVTLPLGATGRMGIAMTALAEGGVNAGIEGLAYAPKKDLLGKMKVDDDSTFLRAVATGFLGGAGFGGGVRTLAGPEIYKVAGQAINGVGRTLAASKIYQMAGQAIKGVGLRRSAKILQQSDNPTAKMQGHAIEDELNAKALDKKLLERGSLEDDAAFLDEMQGGLEGRVRAADQAANSGTVPALVRTSDEMTHQIEVSADIARTANLMQRYNLGEALTLQEAEALGIPINALQRNVIEYYDMMDARLRGQEVPDDFDPLEEFDLGQARRDAKFEAEQKAVARWRDEALQKLDREVQSELKAVRAAQKSAGAGLGKERKYPILQALKGWGIDPKSTIADELRAMGVTTRTHPGLYKKGGLGDIDNIDSLDIDDVVARNGEYYDRQDLLDAIGEEVAGNPRVAPDEAANRAEYEGAKERANVLVQRRKAIAEERKRVAGEIKANFEEPLEVEFEVPAFVEGEDTPEGFGNDLTRMAREQDARDRIRNEFAGVDRVALSTENGGTEILTAQKLLEEVEADEEFAEQIKLCGLQ